jgi:glycosyltransferase involved in cell wall biosynthesis
MFVATTSGASDIVRGVSVVLCCHNSAERLPRTIRYLAAQQVRPELSWEVVVVDNASTDGTAKLALECWPVNTSAPLRVVFEPKLGLSYARVRGFYEARYEVISFVDDDNWVCAHWVGLVAEIMAARPGVGACGGFIEAESETKPPCWFEQYKECYAVGPQGNSQGDITWSRGYLWGAGLTVRRSAWQQLTNKGFRFLLPDRQGTVINSGGDSELCFALRLAGWRLWYEPRLKLTHYIPTCRLQWKYLRKLARSFGASSPSRRAYEFIEKHNFRGQKGWLLRYWHCQLIISLIKLMLTSLRMLWIFPPLFEGNRAILDMESRIGEFCQLLTGRSIYTENMQKVQELFHIG